MGAFFISFKDLDLKDFYDSDTDDLLNDFYIPILSESIEYHRAVGYFNSRSLSYAARGIKNFILNNGKMRLLCGADLSESDVDAIVKGKQEVENVVCKNFLEDIENLEDNIRKHHVEVLGWMVANDLLDIKIVLKLDDQGMPCANKEGILHFKIGIFRDSEGNYITINGSNNETPFGWGKNFEYFDVYKSWEQCHSSHFQGHVNIFNKTWEGEGNSYTLMDVPKFAKDVLRGKAPDSRDKLVFHGEGEVQIPQPKDKPILYDYQKEAINKWFANGKKGIFAMATGTGKTFTSLGCLERLLGEEKKLVTIISAPQMHLVKQWKENISIFGLNDKFDDIIVVDSSNPGGKEEFNKAVYNLENDLMDNLLILTTHSSLSLPSFYEWIEKEDFTCPFFFIGDEMHGLGSLKRQKGLIKKYNYRLGLSATPRRHYDEFGTDVLFDYFGDVVYEFSLEDALSEINPKTHVTYLNPFYYKPYFVNLTYQELEDYTEASNKLVKALAMNKDGNNKSNIESLMNQRANILKEASNKFDVLREILKDMKNKTDLIIYCNENQIEEVFDIAGNEFNLSVKSFTSKDNAVPDITGQSDRDRILKSFSDHTYDGLVAMHCLDEGVDVKSATRAILMCNSTNPREFIQRVGRVVRRDKDKEFSEIYDMIIAPSDKFSEFHDLECDIYRKELKRADFIGNLALNSSEYTIQKYDY